MNEWGVVGVLIALVGLIAAIVKPMISLTKSITELSVVVRGLRTDMDSQQSRAHETHKALWEKESEQDTRLENHETRIKHLEGE